MLLFVISSGRCWNVNINVGLHILWKGDDIQRWETYPHTTILWRTPWLGLSLSILCFRFWNRKKSYCTRVQMVYRKVLANKYFKPERSAEGGARVWSAYTQKATINFFKQMAVAHSIFTLGGGFNCSGSFWYAHDRGTIKSCIRMGQIWFLGVSKNNQGHTLDTHLRDYHIRSDLVK